VRHERLHLVTCDDHVVDCFSGRVCPVVEVFLTSANR
jgi:hypothetical protein